MAIYFLNSIYLLSKLALNTGFEIMKNEIFVLLGILLINLSSAFASDHGQRLCQPCPAEIIGEIRAKMSDSVDQFVKDLESSSDDLLCDLSNVKKRDGAESGDRVCKDVPTDFYRAVYAIKCNHARIKIKYSYGCDASIFKPIKYKIVF